MNTMTIYYVKYEDCTDYEPRPGWYFGTDDPMGIRVHGPFDSREEAEEFARIKLDGDDE